MGPTGLDCPVSPPSTCGRTTPIFGGGASQQLFVSIRTSASSIDQGTSTAVPSGASSAPAPKGFPPSGPPLAAHPDIPADLSTSVLARLARSANAPLSSDNTSVSFGLLNIRSLTGKGHLVQDLLTDRKLDFMCLNETWQLPGDFSQLNDCTPPGVFLPLQTSRLWSRRWSCDTLPREMEGCSSFCASFLVIRMPRLSNIWTHSHNHCHSLPSPQASHQIFK